MLRATLAFSTFWHIELESRGLSRSLWHLKLDPWLRRQIKRTQKTNAALPRSRADGRADQILDRQEERLAWLLDQMLGELRAVSGLGTTLGALDPDFAVFLHAGW